MAKNDRNQGSSNRGRSRQQSDQPLMSGWVDTAKERPFAAAAAVGGAVAAGVFLWSRRNQISDQISHLSDQISDWSENMRSGRASEPDPTMQAGGRRASSLGTETGGLEMAGAGTSARKGTSRATGGRKGKAQTGQNVNPSRTPSETVSY